MNEGFDITVGFFNGLARYIAFMKRSGTARGAGDFRAAFMQISRQMIEDTWRIAYLARKITAR
jgi:hypothetical protein